MGLDDSNDNILAAALAADRLAQHAVCLSDARGVPEKKLEDATRFVGW
jgi:hypothetical protein